MVSMHIGTQGPVFFADLGVVSNLTFHEKKAILMTTPSNLIQVRRKITRAFLMSWKSRKINVRWKFTINNYKNKENTIMILANY